MINFPCAPSLQFSRNNELLVSIQDADYTEQQNGQANVSEDCENCSLRTEYNRQSEATDLGCRNSR